MRASYEVICILSLKHTHTHLKLAFYLCIFLTFTENLDMQNLHIFLSLLALVFIKTSLRS